MLVTPAMNDTPEMNEPASPVAPAASTDQRKVPVAEKENESWLETVKTVVYALLIARLTRPLMSRTSYSRL